LELGKPIGRGAVAVMVRLSLELAMLVAERVAPVMARLQSEPEKLAAGRAAESWKLGAPLCQDSCRTDRMMAPGALEDGRGEIRTEV
jgi:hypothetical protein